jgi:anti-anti-sigma factor
MIPGGAQGVDPLAVFSCSVERHAGHVRLGVIGEIDRTSAGQFRNQLLSLAKEHPASIAVDMLDVTISDGACVAVLVETWRFAQEHGIDLTVRSGSDAITRAFDRAPSGQVLTLRS